MKKKKGGVKLNKSMNLEKAIKLIMIIILFAVTGLLVIFIYSQPSGFRLGFFLPLQTIFKIIASSPILIALFVCLVIAIILRIILFSKKRK